MNIAVVHEAWRPHPLAWIHRAEARAIAGELRRAGHAVRPLRFRSNSDSDLSAERLLLRLSDPMMRNIVQTLTRAAKSYLGPSSAVMERCYDKYEAYRMARANGVISPSTALASDAGNTTFPVVLKPRRGSDSIGVRILRDGPIPVRYRTDQYLAQEWVRGAELTVAVFRDRAGMPLRIRLPEGTPYSFFHKYLLRPPRAPLADIVLEERVRRTALKIAAVLGVDWAARIDLIHETATDRLCFLECDAAPLLGAHSAFAASFEAAGIGRAEQLGMLLSEATGP